MDGKGYWGILRNYKGFLKSLMDCNGFKGFHGVLGNFKGFQIKSSDLKGFLRILKDFKGFQIFWWILKV